MVGEAWSELHGRSEDTLTRREIAEESHAEILVRRATEATEEMVF